MKESQPSNTVSNIKPRIYEDILYSLYLQITPEAMEDNEMTIAEIPLSKLKSAEEIEKYYQTLNSLEKRGIILSWKPLATATTECNSEDSALKAAKVQCEFVPSNIRAHLGGHWRRDMTRCKMLIRLYELFVKIIGSYFQNLNPTTEINDAYKKIADDIKWLAIRLNDNLIELPELKYFHNPLCKPYYIPFSSLFSARKEMKKQKLDADSVLTNLNDYQEFLSKLLSVVSLGANSKKIDIRKIEGDVNKQHEQSIVSRRDRINPNMEYPLYAGELKAELTCGDLGTFSDGTIRYRKKIVEIRGQLKELCRLFMKNPERLMTAEDIKEKIISANKRGDISRATIAKYVSELHNSLKIHFKKNVIFNQTEEGWLFKP